MSESFVLILGSNAGIVYVPNQNGNRDNLQENYYRL
jgi:hypothetical protein